MTPRPPDDLPPEEILRQNLPLIQRIAACVGRRHGLSEADLDDFVQEVQLKLVEDDYRRIREFRGGSSLKTYLTTVITRLAKDFCNRLWGKWRPSAAAKRRGWATELLERLVHREGFSFEEAAEKMIRDFYVRRSVEELAKLAAKLPPRTSRRLEGEEALENRPAETFTGDRAATERVDRRVTDAEKAEVAARVEPALEEALTELEAEDRVILKLLFRGWTLAKIARFLTIEQKPLYRRRDHLLERLRQALEDCDVRWEDVQRIIGWERLDLKIEGWSDEDEDEEPE